MDHRGDEASLLADSVWDWDAVAERGPEAFAKEVGSLDKRAPPAGRRNGGNGGERPDGPVGNGSQRQWHATRTAARSGPSPVPRVVPAGARSPA